MKTPWSWSGSAAVENYDDVSQSGLLLDPTNMRGYVINLAKTTSEIFGSPLYGILAIVSQWRPGWQQSATSRRSPRAARANFAASPTMAAPTNLPAFLLCPKPL